MLRHILNEYPYDSNYLVYDITKTHQGGTYSITIMSQKLSINANKSIMNYVSPHWCDLWPPLGTATRPA